MLRTLKLPALYCRKLPICLLSMAVLLQTYPDEIIEVTKNALTLSGSPATHKSPPRNSIRVTVNPVTNLPVGIAHSTNAIGKSVTALNATVCTVDDLNRNLPKHQKELL